MRQEFGDQVVFVHGQTLQHIFEISVRVVPIELGALNIRLMTAAARWPDRREPANNQFFRPIAMGLIWFSAQLLSIGSCPSSAKRVSAPQRLTL